MGKIKPRGYWAKEKIIWTIKHHPKKVKDPRNSRDWIKAGYGSMLDAATKLFGSWAKALKAASFESVRTKHGHLRRPNGYFDNKENIIWLLKHPPKEISNPCSSADWVKAGYNNFYFSTIRIFGGWRKALEAVGIKPIDKRCKGIWVET